jgi:hypothetical protein
LLLRIHRFRAPPAFHPTSIPQERMRAPPSEWPICSAMTFTWQPAAIMSDAPVWRRSWKVSSGMPAARAAGLKTWLKKLSASKGLPERVGKR